MLRPPSWLICGQSSHLTEGGGGHTPASLSFAMPGYLCDFLHHVISIVVGWCCGGYCRYVAKA